MPLGKRGGRKNREGEGEKSLEKIRKEQRARAVRPPERAIASGGPGPAAGGEQPTVGGNPESPGGGASSLPRRPEGAEVREAPVLPPLPAGEEGRLSRQRGKGGHADTR